MRMYSIVLKTLNENGRSFINGVYDSLGKTWKIAVGEEYTWITTGALSAEQKVSLIRAAQETGFLDSVVFFDY